MTTSCGLQRGHSATADRWAEAVLRVIDARDDPRTFAQWARVVGASPGTLVARCRVVGVSPRNSLYLARLLRGHGLVNGDLARLAEVLDVADVRTVPRLLKRAGLHGRACANSSALLRAQRLVVEPVPLESLLRNLRVNGGLESRPS